MRYYKLTRWDGGTPPQHDRLKVGAIVRVKRKDSPLPGAQFNAETREWVTPIWVECDDPREATS